MRIYPPYLLCLLALLSSCHSSRPAFYFGQRPVSGLSAAAADSGAARPSLPAVPAQTSVAVHRLAVASVTASRQSAKRFLGAQRPRKTAPSATARPVGARAEPGKRHLAPKHPAALSDSVLFVGGLLLVGLGVATGLLIGGGPGWLIGLALGVAGCLLLGRGYAGSWKSGSAAAGRGLNRGRLTALRARRPPPPAGPLRRPDYSGHGDDVLLILVLALGGLGLLSLLLGTIFSAVGVALLGLGLLVVGGLIVFIRLNQ